MDLSQIVEEVNKDLDDSLDAGDITGWVNRALDDLTPLSKKAAKYVAPVSPVISLPDDLFEIELLMVNDEEFHLIDLRNKSDVGYKLWGNELTIQKGPDEGEIELYYYKRLSHLEDEDDIPEIEPSFHDLLVLYASAHSQYAEEEPERQMDAMNRYIARKREYQSFVMKNSNETYQVRLV